MITPSLYQWSLPLYINDHSLFISMITPSLYQWSLPLYINDHSLFIPMITHSLYQWSLLLYINDHSLFILMITPSLYQWTLPLYTNDHSLFIPMITPSFYILMCCTWSTPTWYIVVDHPCKELFFWSLPPNSTALSEKALLSLSVYLIPRDKSYQCLQNKNPLSGCKISTFFKFCTCLSMPHSSPYILLVRTDYCDVTLLHYSTYGFNEWIWLGNVQDWAN